MSPSIIEAIAAGSQPKGLIPKVLLICDMSIDWAARNVSSCSLAELQIKQENRGEAGFAAIENPADFWFSRRSIGESLASPRF